MQRDIYVAVFFAGMTSLAIEMSASRLLGNVFGTSNLVWACIIGLILIYLTVGYFLGGRWADQSPTPKAFYRILAWAAFTTGLIPVISSPVLRIAADAFDQLSMGILFGSFTAVLILFIVPMTLLGTASPFAIRLSINDPNQSGRISGRIYAISTLGSFVGTFLPVLALIPTIGTYRTFLTFSGVLLLVALWGLQRTAGWKGVLPYLWMPAVIVILATIGVNGPIKKTAGQVYETESSYNYIQVLKDSNGFYLLRLNEGQGVHSIYHPDQQFYFGPWEQFLAGPFFNYPVYKPENVERIAIVGLAAGTTARQATQVFGAVPIDGYEIDPKIIQIGRDYFAMNESNLTPIAQDGRWGLAHSDQVYSLIAVDAYRPPYIPPHLTTVEFFQLVRDHLTEDGVAVINVGRSNSDRRLIDALAATMSEVFPSIYVMDIPDTFNTMIYATAQKTEQEYLAENLSYLASQPDTNPLLLQVLQLCMLNLKPVGQGGLVFSDDLSQIEWITNNMVLNYVFSGEIEELQ
jgi:predicted membrane-bound spermidine synthase